MTWINLMNIGYQSLQMLGLHNTSQLLLPDDMWSS